MRKEALGGFANSANDFLRCHLIPRTGKEVIAIGDEFSALYMGAAPDVSVINGVGTGAERFALFWKRLVIRASLWEDSAPATLLPRSYKKGVPVKYEEWAFESAMSRSPLDRIRERIAFPFGRWRTRNKAA